MKVYILTFLFCVAGLRFAFADSDESNVVDEDDLGLYSTTEDPGDRLINNFLKVMSAILARSSVPKDVQQAAKTVMKETLNGQPEAAGYKSYLVTSMLRVINNSTGVQLRNMLTIMEESSPPESPMAAAVKVLLDWLQSENGRKFVDYVIDYVRNLFQTLKRRIAGNRVKPHSKPETSPGGLTFNFDNLNILRGRTVGQGFNEDGSYRRPPSHQGKPQHPQKPHNEGDHHGGHRPQHPRPPHHNEDHHGHRPERPPQHHPDHGHRPEHHPDRPHHPQRPHHPHRPNHPHHPNPDKICFERVPDYTDYTDFFFNGPYIYV